MTPKLETIMPAWKAAGTIREAGDAEKIPHERQTRRTARAILGSSRELRPRFTRIRRTDDRRRLGRQGVTADRQTVGRFTRRTDCNMSARQNIWAARKHAERRAAGQCPCGRKPHPEYKTCSKCRVRNNRKVKKYFDISRRVDPSSESARCESACTRCPLPRPIPDRTPSVEPVAHRRCNRRARTTDW